MKNSTKHTQEHIHVGRNIARFRRFRDMKQDILAEIIGITQQSLSVYEQKENINRTILLKIASALNVSVSLLENMTEESFNDKIDYTIFPANNPYCLLEYIIERTKDKEEKYQERLSALEKRIETLESLLQTSSHT